MPLEIPQHHIEAYVRDPVMAAYVFFGIELDHFQAARLRMLWFVPVIYDSSAIGTAKTELLFLWACLRVILLKKPSWMRPRQVGIFYQTLGGAEKVFYQDRFLVYLDRDDAKLFKRELKPMSRGKLGYFKLPDAIQLHFKNGGLIELPAVNLTGESSNLAGRRYDDGGTDEAPEFDAKSHSLDKQITGRCNAESFNPTHPLWTNHLKFGGHAQDPETHPYYKRIQVARREIHDGNPDVALITASFRDWSPEFAKRFRKDKEIRRDKLKFTRALFLQIREGIWAYGSEEWYDAEYRKKMLSAALAPELGRTSQQAIYSMGWDTALRGNSKSDWNAGVISKALPVPMSALGRRGVVEIGGRCWFITAVWAAGFQRGTHDRSSGVIHRQHQRFQLANIVLDGGGGGLAVLRELAKKQQLIDNQVKTVTGICTPEGQAIYPEALPLARLFGRGEPDLQHVWGEDKYRASDEGPIHAIHVTLRNMIESGSMQWPQTMEERSGAEVQAWEAERRGALIALDTVFAQLGNIRVQTGKDGTPKLSSKGFLMFESKSKRKKDFAYAWIYSMVGLLAKLMDPDFELDADDGAPDFAY